MAFEREFVLVNHKQHNLKAFDCGKPVMNQYLARYAVKNSKLGINRTWVLAVEQDPLPLKQTVAAYYTLSSATVVNEQLPVTHSLPRYPIPVVLLAQLAVDQQFKGQRLGEKTLVTAIRKAVAVTEQGLPVVGMALDVLDEDALGFYKCFEIFTPFTDDPMRLFAPMNVLKQI